MMATADRTTIDMRATTNVLDQADQLVSILDGVPFVTDAGKKNPNHAELNRDLLRLADLLDLASSLVRTQYWRMRGFEDPTDD